MAAVSGRMRPRPRPLDRCSLLRTKSTRLAHMARVERGRTLPQCKGTLRSPAPRHMRLNAVWRVLTVLGAGGIQYDVRSGYAYGILLRDSD